MKKSELLECAISLSRTPVGMAVGAHLQRECTNRSVAMDAALYCATVLSYVSCIHQRATLTDTGGPVSLFTVISMTSGMGKGAYIQTAQQLQRRYVPQTTLGTPASAPGLRKAFERHGSLLWAQDEITGWLRRAIEGTDQHGSAVLSLLLELWNRNAAFPANEAVTDASKSKACEEPRLSIFGTATPDGLSPLLKNPAVMTSGFLSRLSVFTTSCEMDVKFDDVRMPNEWANSLFKDTKLPLTAEAWLEIGNYREYCLYMANENSPDTAIHHSYLRRNEQSLRFATLISLAAGYNEVPKRAMQFGQALADHVGNGLVSVMNATGTTRPGTFERTLQALQDGLEKLDAREINQYAMLPVVADWTMELRDAEIMRYLKILHGAMRICLFPKNGTFQRGPLWGESMHSYFEGISRPKRVD